MPDWFIARKTSNWNYHIIKLLEGFLKVTGRIIL